MEITAGQTIVVWPPITTGTCRRRWTDEQRTFRERVGRDRGHASPGGKLAAAFRADGGAEGSHHPREIEPKPGCQDVRRHAAPRVRSRAWQDRAIWPRQPGEHGDRRRSARGTPRRPRRLTRTWKLAWPCPRRTQGVATPPVESASWPLGV